VVAEAMVEREPTEKTDDGAICRAPSARGTAALVCAHRSGSASWYAEFACALVSTSVATS
jgi:hypothetical protein